MTSRNMLRRAAHGALPLALPAALLAAWWLSTMRSTSVYWPPLSKSFIAFKETWIFDRFGSDVVPSLVRFGIGMAFAIVLGVGAGILIGSSEFLRRNLVIVIEYMRALPIPALIPLLLVLLGPGTKMDVVLVAWGGAWPLLVNSIDGVRGIDQASLDVARVYRFGKWRRFWNVIFPGALPQIFAGLRVSLAVALAILIVAEMFAGSDGIGYVTIEAQSLFSIPKMWAGILLLALLGVLVNALFVLLERRVLGWHRGWRQSVLNE